MSDLFGKWFRNPAPPRPRMVHPYYPTDAYLPAGFRKNTITPIQAGTYLAAPLIVIILTTLIAISRIRFVAQTGKYVKGKGASERLGWGERFSVLWFLFCGLLHLFFEGFFLLHHQTLSAHPSLPAALWREYALGDSRYLLSDPFVLSMEAITVIAIAPMALLAAATTAYRRPIAPIWRALVSLLHLLGVTLYYATSALNDHKWTRPEPQYMYGYMFGLNAPWVLVPFIILWSSLRQIRKALVLASGGERLGGSSSPTVPEPVPVSRLAIPLGEHQRNTSVSSSGTVHRAPKQYIATDPHPDDRSERGDRGERMERGDRSEKGDRERGDRSSRTKSRRNIPKVLEYLLR